MVYKSFESLLGHPITSYKPIKLSENESCSEHQTLFFTCKQEYILLCSIYPSVPAFTLEKLEVDVTQDGSPQFQDLGQYHLPHFPQFRLQPQSSNKTQIVSQKYTNTAQIVCEYFQSSSHNTWIYQSSTPLLAEICNYKMNFICNLIHVLLTGKGCNPKPLQKEVGHCFDPDESRVQLRWH